MKKAIPLILLLATATARAALVDIVAHGTVSEVTDPDLLLPIAAPALGTDLEFSIRMNTDAMDIVADDSSTGVYVSGSGMLAIGSAVVGADDVGSQGAFLIQDDVGAPSGPLGDLWSASLSGPCREPSPAPCRYVSIALVLFGVVEELPAPHLDSDALVVPPWPGSWTVAYVSYRLLEESSTGQDAVVLATIRGQVDGITASAVPLPGAAWLLPAAFGPVLARSRRRAKRR